MIRPALAVMAAALLASGTLRAQDGWEKNVRSQIDELTKTERSDGYSLMNDEVHTGSLHEDKTAVLDLKVERTTEYLIVGVCDDDCTDLDIVLSDSNGNQLDSDIEADDVPRVTAKATRSDKFQIKVIMETCSVGPCQFGVGVFAGSQVRTITAPRRTLRPYNPQ